MDIRKSIKREGGGNKLWRMQGVVDKGRAPCPKAGVCFRQGIREPRGPGTGDRITALTSSEKERARCLFQKGEI